MNALTDIRPPRCTAYGHFRRLMRERRDWPRGSLDWQARTNAARKYWWLVIGKPANEWWSE